MGFIRVRQADGPAHEFDISEAAYARNKQAYTVIDKEPVAVSRPVKYSAEKAAQPSARKSAVKAAGKE